MFFCQNVSPFERAYLFCVLSKVNNIFFICPLRAVQPHAKNNYGSTIILR